MISAKRGPSYLRASGAPRSGRVEMPTLSEVEPGAVDDGVLRELQRWEAPVLSDEQIELYAKIFLMRPGHELMPFFLWMDAARIVSQSH